MYYWFLQSPVLPGEEGARQVLGWALGVLEALGVLDLVRTILWLFLILAAAMYLFSTFGVGRK